MPPADDPPIAAAAADEGEPPRPPRRPLSTLLFGLYLTAVAFLLPRLLPSFSWPSPPRHISHIVTGVMKLDDDLSLFTVTSRPYGVAPTHRVRILPGLAAGALSFRHVHHSLATRGLLAAVVDLHGQGRSLEPRPALPGVLQELIDHGVFNGLERLFQTTTEPRPPFPYAPAEAAAAAAVARAAEALGVGPAHLVLHDSALAAGAAFAAANPGMVRSVTLIDAAAAPTPPAFPAAVFRVPVLRGLVLMAPPLFRGLLWMCCVRGIGAEAAHAHRMAMLRRGKTQGVVEASRALNRSGVLPRSCGACR